MTAVTVRDEKTVLEAVAQSVAELALNLFGRGCLCARPLADSAKTDLTNVIFYTGGLPLPRPSGKVKTLTDYGGNG